MKRICSLVVILLIICGLIWVSCQKKVEEKVVKIGAILPLTGPGAPYGESEKKGMDLAIKHVNAREHNIKLIYEDSQTNPSVGVSAARKLIQIDKVKVILGALASSVTLAIAPIAEKNEIVLITPGSSNPEISRAGDYIFRLYPSDDYQGKILAEWAIRSNIKRVAILYVNNDFGKGLMTKFSKVFENKGGEVIIAEAYDQGETNFRSYLTKIGASKAQGLFIIASGQENATILIQAKELGIKTQIFAPDSFKDENVIKTSGYAAEGVICAAPHFGLYDKRAHVRKFVEAYKATYGTEPNVFAAYGYDVVSLISSLINQLGYDAEKIKNALYKIQYEGVTGPISFDKNGDLNAEMDLFVVKNGVFIPLKIGFD